MITEHPGITIRAFLNLAASPPAIAPITRELTASPVHPQVITKPIAVPVIRGKASPTIARVVGNTGAIDNPARKTKTQAAVAVLVRNIKNVVIAIAIDPTMVTVTA